MQNREGNKIELECIERTLHADEHESFFLPNVQSEDNMQYADGWKYEYIYTYKIMTHRECVHITPAMCMYIF